MYRDPALSVGSLMGEERQQAMKRRTECGRDTRAGGFQQRGNVARCFVKFCLCCTLENKGVKSGSQSVPGETGLSFQLLRSFPMLSRFKT